MECTPPFLTRIGTAALRVWIAFSVSSFVVAVAACILDGDNPMRSDDPYLVGFIVATCTALFSLCWGIAICIGVSESKQCVVYFMPLVLLVGLLLISDFAFTPIEGRGLPTFFAIAITLGAIVVYPLHALKLNKVSVTCASIPGILCFIGYSCALVAMATGN